MMKGYILKMKFKTQLDYYFSDKALIKILCQKRIKKAKNGHDQHFFKNISTSIDTPQKYKENEIFSFFPKRSSWIRIKKKERESLEFNTTEINIIQLERTVWKEIKKHKKLKTPYPEWLKKLLYYIENIRDLVLNEELNYNLNPPKPIPILKDKKEKTYRPLAVYGLKDHIIICQIARYLSNCFDPLFSDSSYAFRTGLNTSKIFNHHKAIEDIILFKNRIGDVVYASECDIKKFYDCVNHKIVLEEFDLISKEANTKLNLEISSRAIHFFYSYLRSFSFNFDIKQKEKDILKQYGIREGSIPWVKDSELLKLNSNPYKDRIGVPQGGAISCLIANILLNKVDKTINSYSDKDTFYGRFCDDMVLLNKSKEDCELLLEIYQIALAEMKLISHQPLPYVKYGKEFWSESLKSKLPYRWSLIDKRTSEQRNVPWLSFVGYQVKFDGLVRVRKKSIANELKKQVNETDKIIHAIRESGGPRIDKRAVKFRLQQRLISMSISRFKFGSSNISMCWCAGFRILKENKNVSNQIRRLDRNREKQINRLWLYLANFNVPIKPAKKKINVLDYYGFNYSYYKQFKK